jgi:hypothetical protein
MLSGHLQTGYTRGSKSMIHHWSVRSLAAGAAFLTALAATGIVDADAIVQYIRTGNGATDVMLVYGSVITLATAGVLLVMGLSIAEDELNQGG